MKLFVRVSAILLSTMALLMVVGFLLKIPPPNGGNAPPGPDWHASHVHEYAEHPLAAHGHILLAMVWVVLLGVQFSPRIRSRYIAYHRLSGRIAVFSGIVMGISGVWLALVMPYAGSFESITIAFVAGTFLVALVKGFDAARKRRISVHQRWMIRAAAIALSVFTMRIVDATLFELQWMPNQTAFCVAFYVGWIVNVGVAELWLRRRVDSYA